MALEQIKIIKEVEAEADEIRKKSMAEAKVQLTDGEKRGSEFVEQAEMEAHQMRKEALAKAQEEADIAYSVMMHNTEKECAKMIAEAEVRLPEAVSVIVGRVVK